MHKQILLAMVIGIVVAIGTGIWVISTLKTEQFVKEEDAVQIVRYQYFPARPWVEIRTIFRFLEFNGTHNGNPQFIMYQADPNSKTIIEKEGHPIRFGDEYFSHTTNNRFAWQIHNLEDPKFEWFFVDAKTGEIIGRIHCNQCG